MLYVVRYVARLDPRLVHASLALDASSMWPHCDLIDLIGFGCPKARCTNWMNFPDLIDLIDQMDPIDLFDQIDQIDLINPIDSGFPQWH